MSESKGTRLRQTIAVALSYRPQSRTDAPMVVASGRGALAEAILRKAFDSGVKVRTDPDLAQILSVVEVDSLIPVEAFMAVAEILVRVYQANGQALPHPPSEPEP